MLSAVLDGTAIGTTDHAANDIWFLLFDIFFGYYINTNLISTTGLGNDSISQWLGRTTGPTTTVRLLVHLTSIGVLVGIDHEKETFDLIPRD